MPSIVVVDYGSQYTRLITRRLRELNVFSVIVPHTSDLAAIRGFDPAGIILSGGPQSVTEPGAPGLPDGLLEAGLPVLAICYGMQLVARELGGRVQASPRAGVRQGGPHALRRRTVRRRGGRVRGMDEPRRLGGGAPRRASGVRLHRGHAGRRHGGTRPSALRPAVPPRGAPHPQGDGGARALRRTPPASPAPGRPRTSCSR